MWRKWGVEGVSAGRGRWAEKVCTRGGHRVRVLSGRSILLLVSNVHEERGELTCYIRLMSPHPRYVRREPSPGIVVWPPVPRASRKVTCVVLLQLHLHLHLRVSRRSHSISKTRTTTDRCRPLNGIPYRSRQLVRHRTLNGHDLGVGIRILHHGILLIILLLLWVRRRSPALPGTPLP